MLLLVIEKKKTISTLRESTVRNLQHWKEKFQFLPNTTNVEEISDDIRIMTAQNQIKIASHICQQLVNCRQKEYTLSGWQLSISAN